MKPSDSETPGFAQRRQITVLFADLANSTSMAEEVGEEHFSRLLRSTIAVMSDAVHEHGGRIQEFAGDGLVAIFGAPEAAEDAPLRACQAATAIQDKVTELQPTLVNDQTIQLSVRIGIHAGRAVVTALGNTNQAVETALGDTVNVASRVEALADPGTILITGELLQLVLGSVDVSPIGEQRLKGRTEPVVCYTLKRTKEHVSRFEASIKSKAISPFVGRHIELQKIENLWEKAKEESTQIAQIVGEPGIGKSRLLYEFEKGLAGQRFELLKGHCSPNTTSTAYSPFVEALHRLLRIEDDGASDEKMSQQVRAGLRSLGIAAQDHVPYLLILLGASGDQPVDNELTGIRVREALVDIMVQLSRMAPVVLTIEDQHWLDKASEQLIQELISRNDLHLLCLFTARPEYVAPWSSEHSCVRLTLLPLSQSDTLAVVEGLAQSKRLPEQFRLLISERSEGNPLYTEELASFLTEIEGNDASAIDAAATKLSALPATLENLLAGRMGRLSGLESHILGIAATEGRRFSKSAIESAVDTTKSEIELALKNAEERDIISRIDGDDYLFRHALIRDALYNRLLSDEKKEAHIKIAEYIRSVNATKLPKIADRLAHHYLEGEAFDEAAQYLVLAGENALKVYSIEDAQELLECALELVEGQRATLSPEDITRTVLDITRVNWFFRKTTATIEIMERYFSVFRQVKDIPLRIRYLFELAFSYIYSANGRRAREILDEAQGLVKGREKEYEIEYAYVLLGEAYHAALYGKLDRARSEFAIQTMEKAFSLAEAHGDMWLMGQALFGLCGYQMVVGNPKRARMYADRLSELSGKTGDPRPATQGMVALSLVENGTAAFDDALRLSEETLRIAVTPSDRFNAAVIRAAAQGALGHGEEAVKSLKSLRAEVVARGSNFNLGSMDLQLGAAMIRAGHLSSGVRWLRSRITEFELWDWHFLAAQGHLILGHIFTELACGKSERNFSLVIGNFLFLLANVPRSRKLALRYLRLAEMEFRNIDAAASIAWCLYNQSRLARKDRQRAKKLLSKALDLSRSVDAFTVGGWIEEELHLIGDE